MKRQNVNYFAVGAFVITSLAILLGVLYQITGRGADGDPYLVHYRHLSGLKAGAVVNYQGFRVGTVHDIRPEQGSGGTRFRVELRLTPGWRIPADSVARISANSLLGLAQIEIEEGASDELLVAGAELPAAEAEDLFAVVAEVAGDVQALSRETLRPMLTSLQQRMDHLGAAFEDHLPVILADMQSLVARLNDSAGHLNGIINAESRDQLLEILQRVNLTTANFQELSTGLRRTQQEMDSLLRNVNGLVGDNREDLEQSIILLRRSLGQASQLLQNISVDLESASRNMNEFTRQIRQNPGALLKNRPPKEKVVYVP